jgi:zinc transport system substrate-binding protein
VIVTRQLDLLLDAPIEWLMTLVRSGLIFALVAMVGCRGGKETPIRPVVAVSVLPQSYFVEKIAGDRVMIAVMIPPGANPSTYEPGIDELTRLARAKLYVAVGHPHFAFEAVWVDRFLSEYPDLEVVHGAATDDYDPHIWLSPRLVRSGAENIAIALGEVLPDARETMDENLVDFLTEIDELDSEIRTRLEPYSGRKVFVFHAAWGNFTREYGLQQVSLEEGGKKPGAGSLAAFIEEAKRDKASTIFVQPQFSKESARVVAEEVGARVETLDPLARDWLDNMRRVSMAFEKALKPVKK